LINYVLRVNYWDRDHSRLILDGVRPAITRLREQFGELPVAIRSHWLRGPHLLIGLDAGDGEREGAATRALGSYLTEWMVEHPASGPLDPEQFGEMSERLAYMEDLAAALLPLRSNNTIEAPDYEVPPFLGDDGLSRIRDRWLARWLDQIFAVMEEGRSGGAAGLLSLVERMLLMEQLADRTEMAWWAASPKGQVAETAARMPGLMESFRAKGAAVLPRLSEEVRRRGLLDPAAELDEPSAAWVRSMTMLHGEICEHFEGMGYFERTVPRSGGGGEPAGPPVTPSRAFLNMIYLLFQSCGFSMAKRWFACYLVIEVITQVRPEILSRDFRPGQPQPHQPSG
jgi:hypothetical protein